MHYQNVLFDLDGTLTLGEKLAQHVQGENPLELRSLVTQALNLVFVRLYSARLFGWIEPVRS